MRFPLSICSERTHGKDEAQPPEGRQHRPGAAHRQSLHGQQPVEPSQQFQSGNPAIVARESFRPEALRPRLSNGCAQI